MLHYYLAYEASNDCLRIPFILPRRLCERALAGNQDGYG